MFYADRRAFYPQRPDHARVLRQRRAAGRLASRLRAEGRAGCARAGGGRRARARSSTSSRRRAPGSARAWRTCSRRSSPGKQVVVATATKALQEQLLTKDVPAASAALGRDLDVAVLKGRQNYLCRKSLHTLALPLFRTAEDATQYELLADWIATTETGDRAELSFEPRPTLWDEVAVGADRCAGRRCPFLATCFSEQARARAQEAELVIANHALYFADLAVRARTGEAAGVLPEHDAVVFDEAHRLEESAAAWFGGRVSLGRTCVGCSATWSAPAVKALGQCRPGRSTRSTVAAEELLAGLDPGRGRRRLSSGGRRGRRRLPPPRWLPRSSSSPRACGVGGGARPARAPSA